MTLIESDERHQPRAPGFTTIGETSPRRRHSARTPGRFCPACPASPPWSNAGSPEPMKAPSNPTTSRRIAKFCFRFNRRRSSAHGILLPLLELPVGHDPVRYTALIAATGANKQMPNPPGTRGRHRAFTGRQCNDPSGSHTDQPRSVPMVSQPEPAQL